MFATKIATKALSLAVLLLIGGTVSRTEAAGISWFKDLDKASEVAKKNNQPMMIEFWADWCAPCKVMEEEVYNDPKLIAAVNDRMIPVRIHFDLQKDLVRKYNVPAIPYLVFTDSHGTELMHHRGALDVGNLTALVNAFPTDVSILNQLARAIQKDNNDFESLVEMGRELRSEGFFDASNRYYGKAIKADAAKKEPAKKEPILLDMGLNFLELKDGKQAAEIFERCLKEFPQSSNRPEFLLNLAQSYVLNEQKAKARKFLQILIDDFPQSEASRKAEVLMKSL